MVYTEAWASGYGLFLLRDLNACISPSSGGPQVQGHGVGGHTHGPVNYLTSVYKCPGRSKERLLEQDSPPWRGLGDVEWASL